jgi:hypothetical protein
VSGVSSAFLANQRLKLTVRHRNHDANLQKAAKQTGGQADGLLWKAGGQADGLLWKAAKQQAKQTAQQADDSRQTDDRRQTVYRPGRLDKSTTGAKT